MFLNAFSSHPVDAEGWLAPHQPNCLGCGDANAGSLKLRMRPTGDGCLTGDIALGKAHEGAPGLAHGGALATALDDAFGMVIVNMRRPAVTARLEVDYRRPAPLYATYEVRAWCERQEGRKLFMRAELSGADGIVAEASAVFLGVELQHFADHAG